MTEGSPSRRAVVLYPAGARVQKWFDRPVAVSIPLWLYWARICWDQDATAAESAISDRRLDLASKAIEANPESRVAWNNRDVETHSTMVAITAAAHCLDGLYGTVKPMIAPPTGAGGPPTGRAKRPNRGRQVLETLKLGFEVGRYQHQWLTEIDWLFPTRDRLVHHTEWGLQSSELVAIRTTAETDLMGPRESADLFASSARRARDLVVQVIEACLSSPRPATRWWAQGSSELPRPWRPELVADNYSMPTLPPD